MPNLSGIEWCDYTSNPVRAIDTVTGRKGHFCVHASDGCRGCWAEGLNRWRGNGLAYIAQNRERVRFELKPDEVRAWERMRKPRRIFTCDMTDLFQDDMPREVIDQVFAGMAVAERQTFQVLTKRAGRMREYLSSDSARSRIWNLKCDRGKPVRPMPWPLRNVWLGVSVEDQKNADRRIPELLATPAAIRYVSYEPALGPVDFGLQAATCACCSRWPSRWVRIERTVRPDPPLDLLLERQGLEIKPGIHRARSNPHGALSVGGLGIRPDEFECLPGLDWIICGGESGPGARPMHPDWARSARDQCRAAGAAFFHKQWGEWAPWVGRALSELRLDEPSRQTCILPDGGVSEFVVPGSECMARLGKKAAGRILDGRTWSEFPTLERTP